MPRKVWDEITYPLPNFNGSTIQVLDNSEGRSGFIVFIYLHLVAVIETAQRIIASSSSN